MRKYIITIFIICLTAFVIYMVASNLGKTFRSYQFSLSSYEDAQHFKLVKDFIPPEANMINYYIKLLGNEIVANFKITEKDFIAWANKKKWLLESIDESNPGLFISNLSSEQKPTMNDYIVMKSGYFYTNQNKKWNVLKDPIIKFAYDKNTGIGYFTHLGIEHEK